MDPRMDDQDPRPPRMDPTIDPTMNPPEGKKARIINKLSLQTMTCDINRYGYRKCK